MALRAYGRVDSGVAVVEFEGSIVLGDGLGVFRDIVGAALEEGFVHILLDLEGVPYMDSAGLGEMVSCHRQVAARGGQVKLVNLNRKPQGLMQLTKLTTIFETFDDEGEAVRSFAS